MKRIIETLAFPAMILLFAACSSDDDPVIPNVQEYKACNLISAPYSKEQPQVSECSYFVKIDLDKSTMQIKTNQLVFDGQKCSFTTPENSYAVRTDNYFQVIGYSSPTAELTGPEGIDLTDLTCRLVSRLNFSLTPVPGVIEVQERMPRIYATYKLGDRYNVRTFSKDSYYNGVTTTEFEYKGNPSSFQDGNGGYRVILDLESRKADVIMYNIKFAERAPYLTLVLEDLDLKFNSDGYVITGENIVAKMLEAGDLTSYEARPFTKFSFTTAGKDLTSAEIKYEVKDNKMGLIYKGSFSGSVL